MIPCRFTEATNSDICSSPKSLRGLKPSRVLIFASGTIVSVVLIA
jgi:hypothetical protein